MSKVIGQTVQHYEIEAEIGRGGMGVVYRARDVRLNRAVAIKFLPEEVSRDADRKRRFMQEARAACAVNHAAIAQIYDVGESEAGLFIVMELVAGRTVRSLVQGHELDVPGALEIAIQVASGLAKAHETGIVHRDIKADNIIVTADGHAKILDFGLAKLLDSDSGGVPAASMLSRMETRVRTQVGYVVGTLQYMSPEQARGQAVDHRSDIFSLGIVLYEMLTGQLPFGGTTAVDTFHAIAYEDVPAVTTLRPNLPASVQRVVARCLRKQRDQRYDDARSLVADLKLVKEEIESGSSHPRPLSVRLQERLRALRDGTPREWLVPIGGTALALVVVAKLVSLRGLSIPALLFFGFAGLVVYRWIRNRPQRLLAHFTRRLSRLPEVRFVIVDGQQVVVLCDRALAKTYVRANALMDELNARFFFGAEFAISVRDDLKGDEVKRLMSRARTLYARRDLLDHAHDEEPPRTTA